MPIPIFAPYTWEETETVVTVRSRIHGATPTNTDFFCSPVYVKANCSQPAAPLYMLELDLFAEVEAKRSSAAVCTGEVTITLHKVEARLWGQLTVQCLDKAERIRRRKRSVEAAEKAAAADADARAKASWDQSRLTLNSQMELDRAYRGVLEDRKAAEKAREDADLDAWQSATEQARLEELRARYTDAATAMAGTASDAATTASSAFSTADQAASARQAGERSSSSSSGMPVAQKANQAGARTGRQGAALPPVRTRTRVECSFTPKMTSAPLRTKGRGADYDPEPVPLEAPGLGPSRARALRSGDLYDISQRDPAWLKDRGDCFFRLQDYAAAVNAYTAVLKQFPEKIPAQAVDTYLACISNRVACHLAQEAWVDAAVDATHAIALHDNGKSISNVPMSDDELKQRARQRKLRLLLRRAAALCHAGLVDLAVGDLELAIADYAPPDTPSLDANATPGDVGAAAGRAQMRDDLAAVKARAEQHREAKACADVAAARATAAMQHAERTADADDKAARHLAAEALVAYTTALELCPTHIATLANAAAMALQACAHARCVSMCDTALRAIDAGMHDAPLCPVRTRIKLLLRRAAAKCELGNWRGAHGDIRKASGFAPSDASVTAQLHAICEAAKGHGVDLADSSTALVAAASATLTVSEGPDAEEGAAREAAPSAAAHGVAESHEESGDGLQNAQELKAQADTAFAAGDPAAAAGLYTRALAADAEREWVELTTPMDASTGKESVGDAPAAEEVTPADVLAPADAKASGDGAVHGTSGGLQFRCQCLSNRSACMLKLGDHASVLDDCMAALTAVGYSGMSENACNAMMLKLRLRRAAAYVELRQLDNAVTEYEAASEIAPEDAGVRNALTKLRQTRAAGACDGI